MAEIFHGEGNGGRTGRVIARRPLSGEYLSGGRRTDRVHGWGVAGAMVVKLMDPGGLSRRDLQGHDIWTCTHAHTTAQVRVPRYASALLHAQRYPL